NVNTSYSQSNLRHNQILIWLCILSFFSVLNEMVLNVSLPDIANDFNKPPASTNWVNTAFMLTFSIGTAVYGKLSDQLGIKRRSEEHTSELQSRFDLVCRLLLEKK